MPFQACHLAIAGTGHIKALIPIQEPDRSWLLPDVTPLPADCAAEIADVMGLLRSAVIYRKLSLGSQSAAGEQRAARLLSAYTPCRLQRRPLHAYLAEAITAHNRGDPVSL